MSEEVVETNIGEEVVEAPAHPPRKSSIGLRIAGSFSDIIGYLTEDPDGHRWILDNPAEIHYKQDESKGESVYKIVFIPLAPASAGVVYIPYGRIDYVFDPKSDIKMEYETKFEHSPLTGTKRTPVYEG